MHYQDSSSPKANLLLWKDKVHNYSIETEADMRREEVVSHSLQNNKIPHKRAINFILAPSRGYSFIDNAKKEDRKASLNIVENVMLKISLQ